jgi:hypothetical protein
MFKEVLRLENKICLKAGSKHTSYTSSTQFYASARSVFIILTYYVLI